uniref:Uncharacterized protein n=1 Tax=Rhizophora mucronata TaxID=61149 RepID=A0A2P2LH30_RHIMU
METYESYRYLVLQLYKNLRRKQQSLFK